MYATVDVIDNAVEVNVAVNVSWGKVRVHIDKEHFVVHATLDVDSDGAGVNATVKVTVHIGTERFVALASLDVTRVKSQ